MMGHAMGTRKERVRQGRCAVDCQSAVAFPMSLCPINRRLTVYGTLLLLTDKFKMEL